MFSCSCLRPFLIRVLNSLGVVFEDSLCETQGAVDDMRRHVNARIVQPAVAAAQPQEDPLIRVLNGRVVTLERCARVMAEFVRNSHTESVNSFVIRDNHLAAKLASTAENLSLLDARVSSLIGRICTLEERFTRVFRRIDKLHTDIAAMQDDGINALESWTDNLTRRVATLEGLERTAATASTGGNP